MITASFQSTEYGSGCPKKYRYQNCVNNRESAVIIFRMLLSL